MVDKPNQDLPGKLPDFPDTPGLPGPGKPDFPAKPDQELPVKPVWPDKPDQELPEPEEVPNPKYKHEVNS